MILWAVLCWKSFGPGIQVDVTLKCTTYLNTVTEQVHPIMPAVFPDRSGIFQQDNAPFHTAKKLFRNGLKNMKMSSR